MSWTKSLVLLVLACPPLMPGGMARAQEHALELSYAMALQHARNGPAADVAEARVEEARADARVAGRWRHNPHVLAMAGPRFEPAGQRSVDGLVRVTQSFPLARTGAARAALAEGRVRTAELEREDATRRRLHATAQNFVLALHAAALERIAREERERAARALAIAERRASSGDGSGIEVTLAEVALARSDAEHARASALVVARRAMLARGLGLEQVRPTGSLRTIALDRPASAAEPGRPDLAALRARVSEAEADLDLARTARAPELTLGVQYQREERADIVRGVVGLSLPLFDRDQGRAARAEARRARALDELTFAQRAAEAELVAARATTAALAAAVERHDALAERLARAETFALRAYEQGASRLDDLLAVQRELLAARRAHADLLRDAALATAALRAALDHFDPGSNPSR